LKYQYQRDVTDALAVSVQPICGVAVVVVLEISHDIAAWIALVVSKATIDPALMLTRLKKSPEVPPELPPEP
jgi:hypothetical protein